MGFMGGPPPGGNEPPRGYGTTGGLPANQQKFIYAIGEKFEIQFFSILSEDSKSGSQARA